MKKAIILLAVTMGFAASAFGAEYCDSGVFCLDLRTPGSQVNIYPSQSYDPSSRLLELSATGMDVSGNALTTGALAWSLVTSSGSEIASGSLAYDTGATAWNGSEALATALSAGAYSITYTYTGDSGAAGSVKVPLAMAGPYTLTGKVHDGINNLPMPGVTVMAGTKSAVTDYEGFYTLQGVDGETITATGNNLAPYGPASLERPASGITIVHDFKVYPATSAKPVITGIRPAYNGMFLAGFPFTNTYDVTVDWNGAPGPAEFYTNNTLVHTVTGDAQGASDTLEVGTLFQGSITAHANKVRVRARNAAGQWSDFRDVDVTVLPVPAMSAVLSFGNVKIGVQATGAEEHLTVDVDFPQVKLDKELDLSPLGKFGGEFAVNWSLDYTITDGSWEATVGVGGSFDDKRKTRPLIPFLAPASQACIFFGDKDLDITFEGGASGTATSARGFTLDEGTLGLGLDFKAELARFGILDLAGPGITAGLSEIPGLGDYLKVQAIIIYGILGLDGQGTWTLSPQLNFKNFEFGGDVGVEAAWEPKLWGVGGRVYVGGTGGATFQVPGDLLKQATLKFYAGAEFDAFLIKLGPYEYVFVQLTYPSGAKSAPVAIPAATNPTGPHPASRDYLKAGPPRFVADAGAPGAKTVGGLSPLEAFRLMGVLPSQQKTAQSTPVPKQADLPLMANVFPQSEPALAGHGNELMLLFATDNGAPGSLQFTDIGWTWFDGTNWTTTATILDDTRAEFAPQVATDAQGNALAVWERVKDPDFTTVDISAMASELEIVWAWWDRASKQWTAPAELTSNNYLDEQPLLAGPFSDGSFMTAWTQNTNNLIIGAGAVGAPGNSRVMWSTFNPTAQAWAAPAQLVGNLPYRVSQSFSASANGAIYAWTRDMDGDLSTVDDREVFYCQYNGTTWSAPTQLTNDTIRDDGIKAQVDASGTVYLVWQRDTALVLDVGFAGAPKVIRPGSDTAAFADYSMTLGPAGNLVILWDEEGQNGPTTFYTVYDPLSGQPSQDEQLFADGHLDRSFAPVWDSAGNLTVAYDRIEMLHETKTVTLEGGQTVAIPDVITPGQVDLCATKRALIKDVAILPGGLTAQANSYVPGQPVALSATVQNAGDVAVQDVVVAFYDGDPASGGAEINRQTVAGWLEGNSASTVQTTWTIPEPAQAHTIFAGADPDNAIAELDETNNEQSIQIGGTDLKATLLSTAIWPDGSARIVLQVENAGTPGSPEVTAGISSAIVGRTVSPPSLADVPVPALDPGAIAQVAFDLPAGAVTGFEKTFSIVVDAANASQDIDTGNNTVSFVLQDLDVDSDGDGIPDYIEIGPDPAHPLDTNGDGIPDYLSLDSDGVPDAVEIAFGTNPYDPTSFPKLSFTWWPALALALLLAAPASLVARSVRPPENPPNGGLPDRHTILKFFVGIIFALLLLPCVTSADTPPSVSNVRCAPNGGTVDIYYDLASATPCDMTILVSKDGGMTFPFSPTSITGDLTSVSAGTGKHVTWNAQTDFPGELIQRCAIRVTAWGRGQPHIGAMITVPEGTFIMGNSGVGDDATYGYSAELPAHSVHLTAYQIGKYDVTNQEYAGILNWALARGYLKNSSGGAYAGGDVYAAGQALLYVTDSYCNIQYSAGVFSPVTRTGLPGTTQYSMASHPVENVTWYGAAIYCNWLSEKAGLASCYNTSDWTCNFSAGGYYLPTEAQWERAAAWDASASKHWIYGFMSDTLTGKNRCNYWDGNPDCVNPLGLTDFPYTSPVGWFNGVNVSPNGNVQTVDSPSPAGCYDMSGNVWQWCTDWYDSGYYQACANQGVVTNPVNTTVLSYRVLRGGNWGDLSWSCRAAYRGGYSPDCGVIGIGFRVCR